ncbi:glycerophosphodiester phosphodiesterase family protein [Citreimonas salinaria]|uniref:Glycerophosphoryl diester phosphodiesterase n=1 Tax=Citreimonas salinaria TaxID=321339 RepID=A0A1H3F4M2_9RHOB|nr:glycerophosphodiester phosphodiesterase family protein [Citreimonas salinaria]SDX85288.1 Glycerophosphoryl diester phosphodiesterase [Citreimonas salinaria]
MMLPRDFLDRPIAHRALHDANDGRPENSLAAIRAAIAAGYGIELDLQLSADGQAMVFHDYDLGRLTDATGPLRLRNAKELGALTLRHGHEGIPTFAEVLEIVDGQVPLLIEIKDQDGAMGEGVGPLERAAADALKDYAGAAALMSFNPYSVARLARLAPDRPRGLTTSAFLPEHWPTLPERTRNHLRAIPDFDATGASFVSHDWRDLESAPVAKLRERDVPILCWTIRSKRDETRARALASNVTFEGYAA